MSNSTEDLDGVKSLVWGSQNVNQLSLSQWMQPFDFSQEEKSALVQIDGGPCAVLAPTQAHILHHMLLRENNIPQSVNSVLELYSSVQRATSAVCQSDVLAVVLHQLLSRASTSDSLKVVIVTQDAGDSKVSSDEKSSAAVDVEQHEDDIHSRMQIVSVPKKCPSSPSPTASHNFSSDMLASFFRRGAVLAFVYSLCLSRGLDQILNDLGPQCDPLIDSIHAHGSLALTNLCLIGAAIPNLFDGSKDLGGLVLNGVSVCPDIGYLSLMEHYRYMEVGSLMKSPKNPIWLLSSETHLTVLCSLERSLCASSESNQIKQVFAKWDPNGNGFIEHKDLGPLLKELNLPSDEEAVAKAKSELDEEDLGIITIGAVMNKYFGHLVQSEHHFSVMTDIPFIHYNGLNFSPQSSSNQPAKATNEAGGGKDEENTNIGRDSHSTYSYGVGVIGLDSAETGEASKLALILSTKWPAISINWCLGSKPSVDWR